MKLVRTVMFLACAVTILACKQDKTGTTSTTGAAETTSGATPVRYMAATARITGARCDREVACSQVGAKKRFETRDICTRNEGSRTQDELKAADCPNGVDEKKLHTCLETLAKQDCTKLVSALQSIDECKTATLCLASAP